MSTPLNEKVVSNLEAVLNDMYPKKEYEGTWITAENTVDGMTGKVVAEEETDITVCNKNLVKINGSKWTLTDNNTITNNVRSENILLTNTIKLKAGQTVTFALKLISVPTSSTTFTPYLNDSPNNDAKWFTGFNTYDLNTVYARTYTADEDVEIYFKAFGNSGADTYEFQFWAELGEEVSDYVIHEEQSYTGKEVDIKTYGDVTHIFNTADVNMQAEIRVKEE